MSISPPIALTLHDVAALLQLNCASVRQIMRRLAVLERQHGFPQPLPGLVPKRWSRDLVVAWVGAGGRAPEPETLDLAGRQAAALEARIRRAA